METYDPEKVGERIAWGRSHTVYRYGESEVIRFPSLEKFLGSKLQERIERDIALCEKYLGEYVLPTRMAHDPESGRVATIQPYITGHYLSKDDMSDPEIKRQFVDFLALHERMIADGHSPVELIGEHGVFHRRLSNIMVLPDKKLRIFDAFIADYFGVERALPLFRIARKLVLARQASTIRHLLS